MDSIINRYVNNGNKNGLLLIDMPTGSGKTYSAIQYIYDYCMDSSNKKKIIFITNLKKNLPHEKLEERFKESKKLNLFQKKFLFIDSNMESVVKGWSEYIEKIIPYEIQKSEGYDDFLRDVQFIKKHRDDKEQKFRDYISHVEENLRTRTEPMFRKLIGDYLSNEFQTVEQKIQAIKTNKRWQWVGTLYPAVFSRDKQVIFMSMDKLLSQNSTIVEPSYSFQNSDMIENSIIIIDEFDATKDIILKNIIKDGLYHKVNYVELFKDIHAALHTDEFPASLTTPSKDTARRNARSLEEIIEKLKKKADDIYSTYSLQFKHRTLGE